MTKDSSRSRADRIRDIDREGAKKARAALHEGMRRRGYVVKNSKVSDKKATTA